MLKTVLLKFGLLTVVYQLLFLATIAYVYGSVFKADGRLHTYNVLWVNRDNNTLGRAVNQAYASLEGPQFITLHERDPSEFPTDQSIVDAVRKGHFWGALYTNANATNELEDAISTGDESYDPESAMGYVWDETRYPAISQAYLQLPILQLVDAAEQEFFALAGKQLLSKVDASNSEAVKILFHPIKSKEINIQPTNQGAKVFYNTITFAMAILQQFFHVLALSVLSAQLQVFQKYSFKKVLLIKGGISVLFTFGAALCFTGDIWAFREDWNVNGSQFALTWMAYWLGMHINWLLYEAVTLTLPVLTIPMFVVTWILINISSTVVPPNLSPGFFHWSYALPTAELYQVLTDVWSAGSVPALYRALPIMFSWWVLMMGLAAVANWRKSRALYTNPKLTTSDSEKSA